MEAPKNCCTCEYRHNCKSYYGGTNCKNEREINLKVKNNLFHMI